MTDDEAVRDLLNRAAEPLELGPAPTDRIIAAAHRYRRNQVMLAAAAVLVVAAGTSVPAFVLSGQRGIRHPAAPPAVATAIPAAATVAGLEHGYWSALPASPLPVAQPGCSRDQWTGHELLVVTWGCPGGFTAAAYVPGSGWQRVPPIPGGLGAGVRASFFAGSQLIVLLQRSPPVAAVYSTVTGHWSLSRYPLPLLQSYYFDRFAAVPADVQAAQLGNQLFVAQFARGTGHLQAAIYDIASRSWRQANVPLPAVRYITEVHVITAGARLVLWVSWTDARYSGPADGSSVAVRALTAIGHWQLLSGWPQELANFTPSPASGGQLFIQAFPSPGVIARGASGADTGLGPAYLANARTLQLRTVPAPGGLMEPAIWTGAAVLAISTAGEHFAGGPTFLGPIEALDPGKGTWHQLPSGSAEQAMIPFGLVPAWTGTQLLVTDGHRLWSFGS